MRTPTSYDEIPDAIDSIFELPTAQIYGALLKLLLDYGATADEVAEAAEESWTEVTFERNDLLADWTCFWISEAFYPYAPSQDATQKAESGYCDV
jgi:hypothetical protein